MRVENDDREALILRLVVATVGSCTCETKTPELQFHDLNCRYRLLSEAHNALASSVPLSTYESAVRGRADFRNALRDERKQHGAEAMTAVDGFELGYEWASHLFGSPQNLEDSRGVGRTLCSDLFAKLPINRDALSSFASAEDGIIAAKAEIRRALSSIAPDQMAAARERLKAIPTENPITSGSPGPLYSAGFASGWKEAIARVLTALEPAP